MLAKLKSWWAGVWTALKGWKTMIVSSVLAIVGVLQTADWATIVSPQHVGPTILVIAIVVAFFAAVAIARTNFRGRRAYIVIIILIQMIPQTALIIPLFVMLSRIHQQNQLSGVVFTYLALVLPFSVWTLRGFVANIPKDLEEAAMIDGCSRVGAFMRVTFPLVAPGLVATAIFAFIQAWNEFTFAYVIIQDNSKETATVWLASFVTQQQIDWGGMMAGATMLSIPIVILFLLVQKHFATGLTAGAVKG